MKLDWNILERGGGGGKHISSVGGVCTFWNCTISKMHTMANLAKRDRGD